MRKDQYNAWQRAKKEREAIAASKPAENNVLRESAPAEAVCIDRCDFGHKFAKLADHPTKDGVARCPHCLSAGLDAERAASNPEPSECRYPRCSCVVELNGSWKGCKASKPEPRTIHTGNKMSASAFVSPKPQACAAPDWCRGRCECHSKPEPQCNHSFIKATLDFGNGDVRQQGPFCVKCGASPEPVGINGLTYAEESETASVMGIVNRNPEPISDVTEAVTRTVIEVEKLLCEKLGKQWQPSGMSIQTLVDELAASKPEPQAQRSVTKEEDQVLRRAVMRSSKIIHPMPQAQVAEPEVVAWFKHGPYEENETLACVFDDPKDEDCFSALIPLQSHREALAKRDAALQEKALQYVALFGQLQEAREEIAQLHTVLDACVLALKVAGPAIRIGHNSLVALEIIDATITQAQEARKS